MMDTFEYVSKDKRLSWITEDSGEIFLCLSWKNDGQVFQSIIPAEDAANILIQYYTKGNDEQFNKII